MSKNLPMLWHIPLSHFNEKVRWALDFKNIPHQRQRVGADYLLQAWRATGHGTLPILFLDGKPIRDSTAIIAALEQRHPEPALYPKDEAPLRRALELEDYFDEVLGPSVRAAIVSPLFHEDPDLALRVLMTGMPDGAYRNLRRLGRIFPAYYRFRHKIKAQRLQQDRADVADALDRISRELQPSGYLVGEREQRQWHFDAERLRGVEVEIEHSCRIFRPDLPAEAVCRAGLRPSGRGGGGISRGSIVRPGAALSRPGTAAGYRAEQPPRDIEAPRAAAAPLASLRP